MITFDDCKKVELVAGEVLTAEKVPDTDKLLKLSVNLGEAAPRQIVSGIALHVPDPSALVGRKFLFATNIPPRTICSLESNGMILALSGADGSFSLVLLDASVPVGTCAS